jgi:hypothetical protein
MTTKDLIKFFQQPIVAWQETRYSFRATIYWLYGFDISLKMRRGMLIALIYRERLEGNWHTSHVNQIMDLAP